jgi:hypothetical protein
VPWAMSRTLEAAADRTVRLRRTSLGISVSVPGRAAILRRQPARDGQSVLERFIREAGYGQDCRDL